jgi:peptide/nickel transport system permease protein
MVTFLMLKMIPGDPVVAMLGPEARPEQVEALREELGFNLPVPVQFARWVNGMLHGDLGTGIVSHKPVIDLIKQRLPITMYLSFWALIWSTILGILAGIISAVRRGGVLDSIISVVANIGISVPSFWIGILSIYFFGLKMGWLPIQGYVWPDVDAVKHFKIIIMPVFCLGISAVAVMARQTRSSMLEVVRQDFIRTAKSKGLRERVVVMKHALKNALIPVITLLGLQLRILVGGSVLVETIFNIPGMGRLLVQSAFDKDYPVLQAGVLIISVVVCLANLLVDLSYGWFDPRIRYE